MGGVEGNLPLPGVEAARAILVHLCCVTSPPDSVTAWPHSCFPKTLLCTVFSTQRFLPEVWGILQGKWAEFKESFHLDGEKKITSETQHFFVINVGSRVRCCDTPVTAKHGNRSHLAHASPRPWAAQTMTARGPDTQIVARLGSEDSFPT